MTSHMWLCHPSMCQLIISHHYHHHHWQWPPPPPPSPLSPPFPLHPPPLPAPPQPLPVTNQLNRGNPGLSDAIVSLGPTVCFFLFVSFLWTNPSVLSCYLGSNLMLTGRTWHGGCKTSRTDVCGAPSFFLVPLVFFFFLFFSFLYTNQMGFYFVF